MIPAAPFDHQTRESLEALANVYALCLRTWPCGKEGCERCEEERDIFWRNVEAADDVDRFQEELLGL